MLVNNLFPSPNYKPFVPSRSGLHREAVIALYRALLAQCSRSPFDDVSKEALRNVARNRFKANRRLTAPRSIKLAFYAGYKGLDHLDSCVAGHTASIERVGSYLNGIPDALKQSAPKKAGLPPKPGGPPYVTPPEQRLLNVFPREKVNGIRKVPYFIRAGGFPMLRYKKPQPVSVSRTLRGLIKKKHQHHDRIYEYDHHWRPLSRSEDQWDRIVAEEMGEQLRIDPEESWGVAAADGKQVLMDAFWTRHGKTLDLAVKMVDIVEKEQELADKERLEQEAAGKK